MNMYKIKYRNNLSTAKYINGGLKMEQEYSEIVFENIMNNTEAWIGQFKNSSYYKTLSKDEKEVAAFIVNTFTEWNYTYDLRRPREWTKASLEYVLLDLFPSKIVMESSFFNHVEPVLKQYFLFLNEIGKIKNSRALIKELELVVPEMLEIESDEDSWGIGKQMSAMGYSLGLDMSDEEDIQRFIQIFNELNELN